MTAQALESLTREGRSMAPRNWPIRPDDLAKQYSGRWVIGRDLNWDGTHGDWTAYPCSPGKDKQITAGSIDKLAELLKQAAGGGRRG